MQLRQGPQIVVGTPGRVMDLIRRGWLQLSDTPLRRARRGRRDALARLHGGRRVDPQEDAVGPPDAALLGHHAGADPQARRPLPLRARAREGGVRDADRRDDRPGHRRRRAEPQAGRAVRDPRARPPRRRDRVPAPQDDGRRARRPARRARLRRRAAARRHAPGPPRRRDAALPQRPREAARRDQRRRPRPRHLAHLAHLLLRRAGRSRGLHAPHRPHRPRRPQRHRLHVHDEPRPQGRGRDRARHGREGAPLHGRPGHRAARS